MEETTTEQPTTTPAQPQYVTRDEAMELAKQAVKNAREADARRAAESKPTTTTTATPSQDATATRLALLEKQLEDEKVARRNAILDSSLKSEMLSAGIDPKRVDAAMLIFNGKHGKSIEWEGDAAFVRTSTGTVAAADFAKQFSTGPEADFLRSPRPTSGPVRQSIGGAYNSSTITREEFRRAALGGDNPELMAKIANGQIKVAE